MSYNRWFAKYEDELHDAFDGSTDNRDFNKFVWDSYYEYLDDM